MYKVKFIFCNELNDYELDTKIPVIPEIGDEIDCFFNKEFFQGLVVTKRIFDFNLSGTYRFVCLYLKNESEQ